MKRKKCSPIITLLLIWSMALFTFLSSKDSNAFESQDVVTITATASLELISTGYDGSEIIGPGGGTIAIGPGAILDIPAGALGTTLRIYHYNQNPEELQYRFGGLNGMNILLAFHLYPENLEFKKPATLTLSYQWIASMGSKNENNLKIAWHDRYEWRIVGGEVDKDDKTISTKITHLGYYGLFSVRPTASLYRSKERILTPAWKDGKNDKAIFDGLNDISTTIKIYDVTGKRVREIEDLPYEWDGKDDDGDIVESGVYIYQFKVNGEIISGTIAIAK